MTEADFYVLQSPAPENYWRFITRLLDKIRRQQMKIYLHCDDESAAKDVSEQLWSATALAFPAHSLLTPESPAEDPVTVGWSGTDPGHRDVLLNFAQEIPEAFSQFSRFAAVTSPDTDIRERCLRHWKFLNDRGYPLRRHRI